LQKLPLLAFAVCGIGWQIVQKAPDPVLTVVALGDSTTAGTPGFRSPLEQPPAGEGDPQSQYAYWLMKTHPDWRVLNRGVNGERTDQIRARFARDVSAERGHGPLVAVIIAGVNDIYQGKSAAEVEAVLAEMYARASSENIPLVAGAIIPYNTSGPDENRRMHEVNDWIREYAAQHTGILFCDTRGAVAASGSPDRLISSPDGLHPSPDGYRLMALALEPAIKRLVADAHLLR
jgi:lysophospholipase L1-like esterase